MDWPILTKEEGMGMWACRLSDLILLFRKLSIQLEMFSICTVYYCLPISIHNAFVILSLLISSFRV